MDSITTKQEKTVNAPIARTPIVGECLWFRTVVQGRMFWALVKVTKVSAAVATVVGIDHVEYRAHVANLFEL